MIKMSLIRSFIVYAQTLVSERIEQSMKRLMQICILRPLMLHFQLPLNPLTD